jgi:hypothetical protein
VGLRRGPAPVVPFSAMRLPIASGALCLICIAACGPSHPRAPVKPPNDILLLGDYHRRGGDGEAAIRFERSGTYRFVKNKDMLDKDPPLGSGTWKINGDQLTLSAQQGMCTENAEEREATYKVVVSKVGIRCEKVTDSCERRATMDGQTWWRLR